jgi:hypothetical protein
MNGRPGDDPILQRFRAALDEIYGDRLERVVPLAEHSKKHLIISRKRAR